MWRYWSTEKDGGIPASAEQREHGEDVYGGQAGLEGCVGVCQSERGGGRDAFAEGTAQAKKLSLGRWCPAGGKVRVSAQRGLRVEVYVWACVSVQHGAGDGGGRLTWKEVGTGL